MGRCFLCGSNSGTGFCSLFDGIVPPWENVRRTFLLKGGPGVGKSTLMKMIADEAEADGETVERFYCSGDPESLDAVRLVEHQIVLLDGTAPHCLDPKVPGAADEIVNLGTAIDRGKIEPRRKEIEGLLRENSRFYRMAYAYLLSAATLREERFLLAMDSSTDFVTTAIDYLQGLQKEGQDGSCFLTPKLYEAFEVEEGERRRLFLEGITCKGRISLRETMPEARYALRVTGAYAQCFVHLLQRHMHAGKRELFFDPILPSLVRHVYFPESDLWVTTENEKTSNMSGKNVHTIDSEEFLSMKGRTPADSVLLLAEEGRLTDLAILALSECKRVHDELEALYHDCIDFSLVDAICDIVKNNVRDIRSY